MPQVPISDLVPQVLPQGQIQVHATPEMFGAQVGAALQQAGGRLEQAGNQWGALAVEQQRINNENAVQDAVTAPGGYSDKVRDMLRNPQSGYFTRQGKDAAQGYPQLEQAMQQFRQEFRAGLTNPMQQRLFDQWSMRRMELDLDGAMRHAVQQNQVWRQQTFDASVGMNAQNFGDYYNDPQRQANERAAAFVQIDQRADREGWDANRRELAKRQWVSAATVPVVERMMVHDPMAAQRYYDAHIADIDPVHRAALEGKLKGSVYSWASERQADELLGGRRQVMMTRIAQEATSQGVNPKTALTWAQIESSMGTAPDRPGSKYRGVYQMGPAAWADAGGAPGDMSDPNAQVRVGVGSIKQSMTRASQALGRDAQPWEGYVVHQQGPGGGPALLKADPNQNAVEALTPAYKGDAATALTAIRGNLPANMQDQAATMTAGQFLGVWKERYAQIESRISVPDPNKPPAPQADAATLMAQARALPDPYGGNDPRYTEMVVAATERRVKRDEFAISQQQRDDRQTITAATMGMAPGAQVPAPAGQRPTSLDALFAISPAVRDAYLRSDPQTQLGVEAMLKHNAAGTSPQMTPEAQQTYYELKGAAVNDRERFIGINLMDPKYVNTLPHGLWHELVNEQTKAGRADIMQQQRGLNIVQAESWLRNDIALSGLPQPKTVNGKRTVPPEYDAFIGKLAEGMDQFRQANNRSPNQEEVLKIGRGLLTQGRQGDTSWLPFGLGSDTPTLRFASPDQSKWYPIVPAAEERQIKAAIQQQKGLAYRPTPAEIQAIYMRRRLGVTNGAASAPGASLPPAATE